MLCYVMLCYVMLCYVMFCYVMLSYVDRETVICSRNYRKGKPTILKYIVMDYFDMFADHLTNMQTM